MTGLVSRLVVVAFNSANTPKERYILDLAAITADVDIHVDMSGGKSFTEALDTGLAGAFAWLARRMSAHSYHPKFYFEWSPFALANPDLITITQRKFNFSDAPIPDVQPDLTQPPAPPAWADDVPDWSPPAPAPSHNPGFDSVHRSTDTWSPSPNLTPHVPALPTGTSAHRVLKVTPQKDPGLSLTIEALRRMR